MGAQATEKPSRRARVIRRFKDRFRLLLINDSTFEERLNIRLNLLNVLLLVLATFFLFGSMIMALIVFTPLKTYIPGYSDPRIRMNVYQSMIKADSLELQMRIRDRYLNDLKAVLSGELPVDSTAIFDPVEVKPEIADLLPGQADSLLRIRIAREEAYTLQDVAMAEPKDLAGMFLFAPLSGIVTTNFDRSQGHYGIDIVTRADEAVKACLDGTVTMASWTTDGGHVLHLQHRNDLVSIYKHNSVLLKKVGDRVKAGEAIAMVGNTGELTTGPHLHFELWWSGEPVDPRAYMVFD